MKNFFILLGALGLGAILGLGGCQSVTPSYSEGVTPLDAQHMAPALKELLKTVDRSSPEEIGALVSQWKSWLGDQEVPLRDLDSLTFVVYNSDPGIKKVILEAQFNGFSDMDFLYQYKNTGIYYKAYSINSPGQVRYRFRLQKIDGEASLMDELNPFIDPGWPDYSVSKPPKNFGSIRRSPVIFSTETLGLEQPVTIYLPPEYQRFTNKRFPVLYILDGQNAWNSEKLPLGGLRADSQAEELVKEKKIEPLIIVGVPGSANKIREYLGASIYFKVPVVGKEKAIATAKTSAENFDKWLTKGVVAWVDSHYRTIDAPEHRGVLGTSYSGGAALGLALEYPQIFGNAGSLSGGNYSPEGSPEAWKAQPFRMFPYLAGKITSERENLRLYMDLGTMGTDLEYKPEVQVLYDALVKAGFQAGRNVLFYEDMGGEHNEAAWAKRLPQVLQFLFPIQKE